MDMVEPQHHPQPQSELIRKKELKPFQRGSTFNPVSQIGEMSTGAIQVNLKKPLSIASVAPRDLPGGNLFSPQVYPENKVSIQPVGVVFVRDADCCNTRSRSGTNFFKL